MVNIYQILSYCVISWFFIVLGAYSILYMSGARGLSKNKSIFYEVTISYVIVMLVVLFLLPTLDPISQSVWHGPLGGESIGTLSVLFLSFYCLSQIVHFYLKEKPRNYRVEKDKCVVSLYTRSAIRYLSVDMRDMPLVINAKKALFAEIDSGETVVEAICRIQEECENSDHDLVIVNSVGLGYALRESLKGCCGRAGVVGALPSEPVLADYSLSA